MIPYLADAPVLVTPRLTLRAPIQTDWPHWATFAQSKRAQFIGGPHTARTAWRTFGHAVGHWVLHGFGSFVFTGRNDYTPLGMAGPWQPEGWPEREIGWTIWTPDAEGKGFAFEAAAATRDHAFASLGWATAVSYIEAANSRSIALAERLGAIRDESAMAPETERDANVLVYHHPALDSDGGIETHA